MFGKKKPQITPPKDFHCAVCGVDCSDQISLDRHIGWAHQGKKAEAAATQKRP